MKLKDLPEYCANNYCRHCIYTNVCDKYFRYEHPLSIIEFVKDIEKEIEEDEE